ncbi:hypothetical protein [Kitasatospora sp. MBT63]|uniref:hypothetical protein n=1 Tax=Kitasatospora sp. MBT63 TaxID=1444768 RepID=UPI0006922A9E|nr:hypothetical protein [Kitasatospora sp. MBT63]
MKLHRRVLRLDGREYTVLGLRPGTTARFATNRYHGTWHLLSDRAGAQLLARLLWGLSYERHPGTLVVIDRPFLDPTPFEGEASDPVVLVPRGLTPLADGAARALRRALPLAPPPAGTVRWRTHGLDLALADPGGWDERVRAQFRREGDDGSTVLRRGGLVTVSASPRALREWAVDAARLGDRGPYEMDYTFLGEGCDAPGEVQTFRRYRSMVSSAVVAHREILAEDTGRDLPQSVRERIWHRSAEVRRRTRRPARPTRPAPAPVA